MFQIRTDLAMEAREMYQEKAQEDSEISGVKAENEQHGGVTVTRVQILDENGAHALGKPVGNYITLEMPEIGKRDPALIKEATECLAQELRKMTPRTGESVLVVGLGNWNITPDALGPKVSGGILVTRHLKEYMPEQFNENVCGVCTIAPGVLGLTGIETNEIIKGVVRHVRPCAVIAIDALASRRMDRVNTTIQLADTGIQPGAGVGNRRGALNKETLGVPVIAVGIPTVVDAATIASDALDRLTEEIRRQSGEESQIVRLLEGMEEKYDLIRQVLSPYNENLIVTPKDMDVMLSDMSKLLASGINLALQDDMTYEDVLQFQN